MSEATSIEDPAKERLEKEVHIMSWLLQVTSELNTILARDETELAYPAVIEWLRKAFHAEAAALYSVDSTGRRVRYATGGTPGTEVPAHEWERLNGLFFSGSSSSQQGPTELPGQPGPPLYRLAARLDSFGKGEGCILLGKASEGWGPEGELTLLSLASTLAPILVARREREREARERLLSEGLLAASEKRLRTIFEDARDMVYTSDGDDVVTSINAAGLALTGRSKKSDIVGQAFSTLALNPGDREVFLRKMREDGYIDDYEIVLTRADGKPVFCIENATLARDGEGGIVEVHGIVKDITDRVEGERELWKTNLELAEANLRLQQTQTVMVQHEKLASIGQLAAGVAHEINNPLGFLKSNHSMLEKYLQKLRKFLPEIREGTGPPPEGEGRRQDILELLSRIDGIFKESNEGFARIMSIVANLKNFSRVDRSGDFEHYDLNAGIENTLVVSWNEIKYVAEVHREYGEVPPLRAMGGEISQVILNILVNAAQAIGAQGRPTKGNITIRTRVKAERAILEIEDDGPGIPEAIRNKVFDPFFTTKEPGKGTGLGLSISYDIVVNKHGGSLAVEERAEGGTLFAIELPIAGPPERAEG